MTSAISARNSSLPTPQNGQPQNHTQAAPYKRPADCGFGDHSYSRLGHADFPLNQDIWGSSGGWLLFTGNPEVVDAAMSPLLLSKLGCAPIRPCLSPVLTGLDVNPSYLQSLVIDTKNGPLTVIHKKWIGRAHIDSFATNLSALLQRGPTNIPRQVTLQARSDRRGSVFVRGLWSELNSPEVCNQLDSCLDYPEMNIIRLGPIWTRDNLEQMESFSNASLRYYNLDNNFRDAFECLGGGARLPEAGSPPGLSDPSGLGGFVLIVGAAAACWAGIKMLCSSMRREKCVDDYDRLEMANLDAEQDPNIGMSRRLFALQEKATETPAAEIDLDSFMRQASEILSELKTKNLPSEMQQEHRQSVQVVMATAFVRKALECPSDDSADLLKSLECAALENNAFKETFSRIVFGALAHELQNDLLDAWQGTLAVFAAHRHAKLDNRKLLPLIGRELKHSIQYANKKLLPADKKLDEKADAATVVARVNAWLGHGEF